jgi:hypothetical protein
MLTFIKKLKTLMKDGKPVNEAVFNELLKEHNLESD